MIGEAASSTKHVSAGASTVLAYDDYYLFGQYMDGRCMNSGLADARYKYTEKERDSEHGLIND